MKLQNPTRKWVYGTIIALVLHLFVPLPHPRCRILRKTIKNQSKSASIKETLPLGCTPQKKRCVKRCMSPVTQYNSEVWKSPLLNPEISAVERGIWGCHR